jgi:uncharacterized protein YkwD
MSIRRTPIAIAAALVSLAVPAAAHADYVAQRVATAHVSTKAPQRAKAHHRAKARTAQDCANADLVPSAGNLPAVRAAILCLHNQVRTGHGLSRLSANGTLRRVAAGHSADMVGHDYFDHTTPGGVTMVDRILHSGYVRSGHSWMIGENLEWGTGTLATPRGAMKAWMNSPEHRDNVLRRGYREMGVGISLGTPTPGNPSGATYTVDFGTIR